MHIFFSFFKSKPLLLVSVIVGDITSVECMTEKILNLTFYSAFTESNLAININVNIRLLFSDTILLRDT